MFEFQAKMIVVKKTANKRLCSFIILWPATKIFVFSVQNLFKSKVNQVSKDITQKI